MIPRHCRTVIIGGGIIGSSTAYHLAKLGETDCVVLEQGTVTNGSTWHAAGLVGQLRSNANVTQLLKYSVELYDLLESETGQATGWKMSGGLRLACSRERIHEIKRQITTARAFGLEMHYLTPQEAVELCPVLNVEDVAGAAYLPTDGQANPSDLTQAFVKGAKSKGIRFVERCAVENILQSKGRVTGVSSSLGDIQCEKVVVCTGLWSRALGSKVGVNIPIVPMLHHYVVTGKVQGVSKSLPTVRDPDRLIYFKEEVGGLVFGGYELNPKRWKVDQPPPDFSFALLDFEVDHFESILEAGLQRIPAMNDAHIKQMICGVESFTPDGNFILGEAPELRNLFVGTGFNAFGIASAGGAGKALAEWVQSGAPSMDLRAVDIRRFGQVHRSQEWISKRTIELCSKHYTMSWPHEEHTSARPHTKSVLYSKLKQANACFGEKLGWERANWFAKEGDEPIDIYSYGRSNWHDQVGKEHQAVRERVGIIDQSSFAKFIVAGANAGEALQQLSSNRVLKEPGSVAYTQMLNSQGGIECDVTVTRLFDDEFLVVGGTGYATHHFCHLRDSLHQIDQRVNVTDVTHEYSTLSVAGPNSRKLLQNVFSEDLSNAEFRFLTFKRLKFGRYEVLVLRVSFAGELGYEIYISLNGTESIFSAILKAGRNLGLAHVGYRALESLRLEKGFRALGSDIGPDYTPLEAGMRNLVRLNSVIPFLGQAALIEQDKHPLIRRFACFSSTDERPTLLGRETIYRNGKRVGWTSSAGWGYTVEKNIAYGYVRSPDGVSNEYLRDGRYELEVEEKRIPVSLELKGLYDPQSIRMRS